jgi:uncharacterized membrane protein YphA (DoxX/SURF4 family)
MSVAPHLPTLLWIARALLVCMFPFSAIDKVLHWKAALAQADSSWLPGGPVLLVLAMVVEVAAPLCIVAGWHADIAALGLAAFCVATAPCSITRFTRGPVDAAGRPRLSLEGRPVARLMAP